MKVIGKFKGLMRYDKEDIDWSAPFHVYGATEYMKTPEDVFEAVPSAINMENPDEEIRRCLKTYSDASTFYREKDFLLIEDDDGSIIISTIHKTES